jgi:serine/threonine-protein kinase RsbT
MAPQSCITIEREWDIVKARQLAREMAKEIGFGTVDQARIATTVSELARNIYLYAEKGKLCYEIVEQPEKVYKKGLHLTIQDEGPGIADLRKVMQDGYSTSGGLGAGLPGAKRLMDQFDIQSEVGKGTKITTTKWLC